ncbi:FG-GAP repeat domain-containing protein, partial [Saccharothrix obliqua]|uniref:FG-GAP repeat domain-containing protein n=1 Tax=Saccharothrix obliqua TaxID=2861747 RepID=UPI001C5CF668
LSGRCDAPSGCSRDWAIVGINDFSGDGRPDVLLYNAFTGEVSVWRLDSAGNVIGTFGLTGRCDTATGCARDWKIVATGDMNGDGHNDVVLYNAFTGEVSVWKLNGSGTVIGTFG